MRITGLYREFISSERSGGLLLIACTIISMVIANTSLGSGYVHLWHSDLLSKPVEFWINDGLMTIFFLMVGLEIERELYIGELSDPKRSLLPILAAMGGMMVPALIHFMFNSGTITQNGFGIPMATDIAFSLAILSLLGNRVPVQLKIFLTALAIIDDLGAIIVIALFYSSNFSWMYFGLAMGVFALLFILNRLKVYYTWIYLVLGMVMWFFMYRSGVHATITGVILAFAIPFGNGKQDSVSYKLQHRLHFPVAFIILPLFALANTAISIPSTFVNDLFTPNSYGIILGLLLGKPIGIFLFSMLGIALGFCLMPEGVKKRHLLFTGCIAGIGFTMSIFITLLAFNNEFIINSSKIAVIVGSIASGVFGYLGLKYTLGKQELKPE